MFHRLWFALLSLLAWPAWSQGVIYRCGNEYTNDPRQAEQRSCQVVEGLGVTVPGTRVTRPDASPGAAPPARSALVAAPARSDNRIDAAQQRARDTDARQVLEAELRKAQARLVELQADFKNGEPDKQGIEGRNHQRYLDRVQGMRDDIVRQQSDVVSLKRELARLPAPAATLASTP